MKRTLLYLALLIPATGFPDDQSPDPDQFRTYSREEIFSAPVSSDYSPIKYFAEPDINNDGINDLLVTDTISFGGTGGISHHVYLGKGDDSFEKIPILHPINSIERRVTDTNGITHVSFETPSQTNATFFANIVALEPKSDNVPSKVWLYSHSSARSGSITYLYFDEDGNLRKSGGLEIHSEVGRRGTGGQVIDAIFGEENAKCIKFTDIEVPVIGGPIPATKEKQVQKPSQI